MCIRDRSSYTPRALRARHRTTNASTPSMIEARARASPARARRASMKMILMISMTMKMTRESPPRRRVSDRTARERVRARARRRVRPHLRPRASSRRRARASRGDDARFIESSSHPLLIRRRRPSRRHRSPISRARLHMSPTTALDALARSLGVDVGVIPLYIARALVTVVIICLLYTSPSPRDPKTSRMPSSA